MCFYCYSITVTFHVVLQTLLHKATYSWLDQSCALTTKATGWPSYPRSMDCWCVYILACTAVYCFLSYVCMCAYCFSVIFIHGGWMWHSRLGFWHLNYIFVHPLNGGFKPDKGFAKMRVRKCRFQLLLAGLRFEDRRGRRCHLRITWIWKPSGIFQIEKHRRHIYL